MKMGLPSFSFSLIVTVHYKVNGGPNDLDLMNQYWATLSIYANLE